MKKTTLTLLAALLLWAPCAFSAGAVRSSEPEPALPDTSKSLMDEAFVVETSDEDATDSLNRIAGEIDSGFAPEELTYRAVHHGRSGPFATHEDAYDVTSSR